MPKIPRISRTGGLLLVLFLLAVLLRIIAAHYVDIGTDEMIYTVIPLNIISAGRLSTVEQAPLYFYLVDLGYKIRGDMTLVSGRYPSIFFGALTVVLVFLVTQELFRNRVASIFAAFFAAASGFSIRFSQEMDPTAYFFALLSMLIFLKFLKADPESSLKYWKLYASAVVFALGVLVKPIVLLFLPAFVLTYILYPRLKTPDGSKGNIRPPLPWKVLLILILLVVVAVSPVLIYNYLLFQEKGMTDYYFSVLAGIGDATIYAGQEPNSWTLQRSFEISKGTLFSSMVRFDLLLLLLGLLGMFFSWRDSPYGVLFFASSIAMLFFYLAGIMGSSTHYVWVPMVFSIFAGNMAVKVIEFSKRRFHFRHAAAVLILLTLASTSLVLLRDTVPLRKVSIAIALQEYADDTIPEDAIIVLDPRIYRGIFAWALNDRHYLEGTYFPAFTQEVSSLRGEPKVRSLYYIECAPGTFCGWKPEDFQRIYQYGEDLSTFFKERAEKVGEIKSIEAFNVFRGEITLPDAAYEIIDRTHLHWYTPVGWKYPDLAADSYSLNTFSRKAMHYFGLLILYVDLTLALGSSAWVVWLFRKENRIQL